MADLVSCLDHSLGKLIRSAASPGLNNVQLNADCAAERPSKSPIRA